MKGCLVVVIIVLVVGFLFGFCLVFKKIHIFSKYILSTMIISINIVTKKL